MISDAAIHDMNRELGALGVLVRTLKETIDRQLPQIKRGALIFALVGSFLAHAGEGFLSTLTGCTPAERAAVARDEAIVAADARKAEPYVLGGCKLAEDIPAAADVADLICPAGEAVDKALAALPEARVVSMKTSVVPSADDASVDHVVTLFRVRCKIAPWHADAATADVGAAEAVVRAIEQTPDAGKGDAAKDAASERDGP